MFKTPLNNWVIEKIATFLSSREGFEVEETDYTRDGARTIVRDSFGFRYEINIKTISRIDTNNKNTTIECPVRRAL